MNSKLSQVCQFEIFLQFLIALSTLNVPVSVHVLVLRHHFRGPGHYHDDDYYTGCRAHVDYVICECSLCGLIPPKRVAMPVMVSVMPQLVFVLVYQGTSVAGKGNGLENKLTEHAKRLSGPQTQTLKQAVVLRHGKTCKRCKPCLHTFVENPSIMRKFSFKNVFICHDLHQDLLSM